MRILLVSTGLGLGGGERVVIQLADCFTQLGHQVQIAYLTGAVEVSPKNTVTLRPLCLSRTPWGLLSGILRLRRIVKEFQPDVVHSHMVHANILARVTRLFVSMPRLICTAHSNNEGGVGVSLLYRLTDRLATISTNVSQQAVSVFLKNRSAPPGRIVPVWNGVDLSVFKFSSKDRNSLREHYSLKTDVRVLLTVGRLAPEKNYSGLLAAFKEIATSYPDVVLWIAGDGILRLNLESERDRLGLTARVVFLGSRNDVPDLMVAADYFVLASHYEGFGLVVAEAMASGLPVVATNAGGVSEVLGECGILVPTCDTNALTDGLVCMLKLTHAQRSKMVLRARKHVEQNFDLARIVDVWIELYKAPLNDGVFIRKLEHNR